MPAGPRVAPPTLHSRMHATHGGASHHPCPLRGIGKLGHIHPPTGNLLSCSGPAFWSALGLSTNFESVFTGRVRLQQLACMMVAGHVVAEQCLRPTPTAISGSLGLLCGCCRLLWPAGSQSSRQNVVEACRADYHACPASVPQVYIPVAGTWTFGIWVDDGARLWIDSVPVLSIGAPAVPPWGAAASRRQAGGPASSAVAHVSPALLYWLAPAVLAGCKLTRLLSRPGACMQGGATPLARSQSGTQTTIASGWR